MSLPSYLVITFVWCVFVIVFPRLAQFLTMNRLKREMLDSDKAMENEGAFEGDIEDMDLLAGRSAVSDQQQLWPNATVIYNIDKSMASHEPLLRKAMAKIEQVSCVRFRAKSHGDNDYVHIFSGSGCRSHVGRKGGVQSLSLGRGCRVLGIMMHELLHAIGFYHMHSRSDRDKYLLVHWENVRPGSEKNFVALRSDQNQIFTEFDFGSVMMYGPTTFSKDHKSTTLEARTPHVKFSASKYKQSISDKDSSSLKKLYACHASGQQMRHEQQEELQHR